MHDPDDKQHFAEMLAALNTGGLKADVTRGMLKVYWMGLSDLPLDDFDKAVGRALQECEFFPTVAKLRELGGHKVKKPEPGYLRPVEGELERIETCQFHVKTPGVTAPSPVSWCRKCKRLRIAAERGGAPSRLDDMLHTFGLLPPLEKEGQK